MRSSVRLNPIYRTQAVDAVIDLGNGAEFPLRALDKTAGRQVGTGVEVETLGPAAVIRATELAALGIDQSDLDFANFLLNGVSWIIQSVRPLPGALGEADGEYMLFLNRAA